MPSIPLSSDPLSTEQGFRFLHARKYVPEGKQRVLGHDQQLISLAHAVQGLRGALNAVLFRTGDQSRDFAVVLATNRPGDLDSAILDRMDEALEFGLPGVAERQQILSLYLDQYIFKAGTVEGGAGAASSRGLWQRFSVSHTPTPPPSPPSYKRMLISKAFSRPCNFVNKREAAVGQQHWVSQLLKRTQLVCNKYIMCSCSVLSNACLTTG